ncbi:hypothetical protein COEREDRAFT_95284 [Coemansia reversa NRRL 1564]|uniref:26S proteasome complex subunit SEM1 n=1 Tax=Coemansia reversa (strain ATCC 12441 / NRRL 1564) TaxID=763665 RepID=A0A2G5BJC1_COERN|nr:hypothetical protein COEREDRAFT_95284 [Coemansia reversa NRRL 1564]|eukprot:PIA19099.1 hypothetical protein COEREDRAFT_95284 [Coemansia reversa NRRL 1564]
MSVQQNNNDKDATKPEPAAPSALDMDDEFEEFEVDGKYYSNPQLLGTTFLEMLCCRHTGITSATHIYYSIVFGVIPVLIEHCFIFIYFLDWDVGDEDEEDINLWDDSWDDDDMDDDFSKQLRVQLEKASQPEPMAVSN